MKRRIERPFVTVRACNPIERRNRPSNGTTCAREDRHDEKAFGGRRKQTFLGGSGRHSYAAEFGVERFETCDD